MFGIISSILQLSVFIQKGTSKPKPPVVVEHLHSTEVNGGGLNDCVKMTAFHDSLLSAVDDTKCLFEFNANYECTIPVIEVVVNCIKGLKVNKQCVRNIHEILENKGQSRCFCGGFKKLRLMTSLTKQIFCAEGARQGRGPLLLAALQTALIAVAPTTTTTNSTTAITASTGCPKKKLAFGI